MTRARLTSGLFWLLCPLIALADPGTTPTDQATPAAPVAQAPSGGAGTDDAAPADKLPPGQTQPALSAPQDQIAPVTPPASGPTGKETDCTDRKDNDNDGMVDCADADCFKTSDACKPGGGLENTNAACSDFVDNDGNGFIDCDDADCFTASVTVCQGSWRGAMPGAAAPSATFEEIPELQTGMSIEDLIGKGKDKDGERSDEVCSDGFDNDNDGLTDCADFGCRFDPSVNVCRVNPGIKFSVVASVAEIYDFDTGFDTRFSKLQLRAFGPLPMIQDSFFLLSMRTEKTPRLTFAMFQVPLGKGHFLNINSGGGGLSTALIISDAKQLLLDPAYYVYNAFEQGNGAAAEVSGPLTASRRLNYRAFVAGGSGQSTGNIGGRFFRENNTNYTWSTGAQVGINVMGYYNRFDSPYLYTPVPATLAFLVGAKYDQRATERYPAVNMLAIYRYKRFLVMAEGYAKRELEFESNQASFNVAGAFLLWPKHLMLAADYGGYFASEFGNPAEGQEDEKPLNEMQFRAALHWYFWRNIGLMSLRYQDRTIQAEDDTSDPTKEREIRLEAQYRF